MKKSFPSPPAKKIPKDMLIFLSCIIYSIPKAVLSTFSSRTDAVANTFLHPMIDY